jgi:hypothetical protein
VGADHGHGETAVSFPEPLQWNGDEPDPYDGRRCDACGEDCGSHPVELPFGTYCTPECADAEQAAFDERMRRRGFQIVQPDIFDNPFGD